LYYLLLLVSDNLQIICRTLVASVMHYGSHNLSSQEKEFAWLLETEFDVKLDAMSRCMEVLETNLSLNETLTTPSCHTHISCTNILWSKTFFDPQ